jgi:6-phosphogluconolactonase (cycloisomerase 2 family)
MRTIFVPKPRALFRSLALLPILCFFSALFGCGSVPSPATNAPTTPVTAIPTIKPGFVYTSNQGASLSGYSVDSSTGALTPLSGFPLAVGLNPDYITHDSQNRFLFVSDIAASMLHVYAINPNTGGLSEISPSPYNTMIESETVQVDPSGTHVFLYRTGSSASYPGVSGNQIVIFNLSSTGVLSPATGSPYLVGAPGTAFDSAFGMAIGTSGKFLYLKDSTHLYTFGIDTATGSLSLLQTLVIQEFGDLAVDPGGLYLYVAGASALMSYAIDPNSGLLSLPKTIQTATGSGAFTIAISPNGKYAYTVEGSSVVSYTVSNGTFTHVGAVYPGIYGQHIAVDPSGSFVYVPQACSYCPNSVYNVVFEFAITTTGALTPLTPPSVAAGVTPWGITVTSQ